VAGSLAEDTRRDQFMNRKPLFVIPAVCWVLIVLSFCIALAETVEVYNPAGIRQDGVYVDELLKKAMTETKKTRPPLAAQFPKAKVEKVSVSGDGFAEINDLFYKRGWTDGLPIVPPTKDRVQEMLKGTQLKPDQIVGTVELMKGQATVEKIAANAVMAGCRPAYLPVLIAAVQAVAETAFGLYGLASTTNPDTPMLIVNGPIARQLEINSGTNALGRGWSANATIGRALHLIVNNIGGSWPGVTDMSCLGTPGDFAMMLAENEEKNPWQPLHVELGYSKEANVVTAVGAEGTRNLLGSGLGSKAYMKMVADHLVGSEHIRRPVVVLIIAQDTAAMLAREGWTKAKIKEFIQQNARIPFSKYKERFIDTHRAREAPASILQTKDPNGMIPVPMIDNFIILVAGGPGEKSMLIPCWGGSKAVSKEIKLPGNWDRLLGELKK
jgi:hypothetical protein